MFGWKIPLLDAIRIADYAVEHGVIILDTSPTYGNGLSEMICARIGERHSGLKISTKFSIADASLGLGFESHVENLCYQSLSRLGRERLDYFVLHRDNNIDDIDALCRVILKLKDKGVVDRFFISNSTIDTYIGIQKFEENNLTMILDGLQLKKNLLFEDALFEIAPLKLGECIYTYSPLCEGLLTGKYLHCNTPPPFSRLSEVTKYHAYYTGLLSTELVAEVLSLQDEATDQGLSLIEYSYRYILSINKVSGMIVGPSSSEQFKEVMRCVDRFSVGLA